MAATSRTDKTSKFLSFVLRHDPAAIGLTLDKQGWADIDELIAKANEDRKAALDRALIEEVVETNDKKRFAISEDGQKIRANQGHSINVNLQLPPIEPPQTLYHGTASRFLDSIVAQGLKPQKRQQVHLSADIETARSVGRRYGSPVILTIDTQAMHLAGIKFYQADNGVWLVDSVPAQYVRQ